jgi:hypothetical protein
MKKNKAPSPFRRWGFLLFLTGFNTPQLAAKCLFPGWGYPVACCGVVHLWATGIQDDKFNVTL